MTGPRRSPIELIVLRVRVINKSAYNLVEAVTEIFQLQYVPRRRRSDSEQNDKTSRSGLSARDRENSEFGPITHIQHSSLPALWCALKSTTGAGGDFALVKRGNVISPMTYKRTLSSPTARLPNLQCHINSQIVCVASMYRPPKLPTSQRIFNRPFHPPIGATTR